MLILSYAARTAKGILEEGFRKEEVGFEYGGRWRSGSRSGRLSPLFWGLKKPSLGHSCSGLVDFKRTKVGTGQMVGVI